MNDFTKREIWIPIDVTGDAESIALTGNAAMMYKGGEVMFRFALYNRLPVDADDPGEFIDHSKIALFLLKIRSISYAGSLLMDSSSGATLTLNATAREDDFIAKRDAPISIYCPNAITAIAAGTNFMTFSGSTTDTPAQVDGFGRGQVSVIDIGLGLSDSAAPGSPTAVTSDQLNAALALCAKYGKNPPGKNIILVSPNGTYGRNKACNNDGEETSDLETYP